MREAIRIARDERVLGKNILGSGRAFDMEVRVGAGAMTAAGSVVLKGRHVEDDSVVAGVPARPLKPVE